MRDAARLSQMRGLAHIQEILTFDATAALADARDEERAAHAMADADAQAVERMAEHWYRHLAGPVMPERGIAIASMLVDRESAAQRSQDKVRQAIDHCAEREHAWRAADAFERASDRIVGMLKRKQARKAEERALDALADRVTIDWMKA